MTFMEELMAFFAVMGVISIPLAAVITRKNSVIGQAWADRIRRKTTRRIGDGPAQVQDQSSAATPHVQSGTDMAQLRNTIEGQQHEIRELADKVDFLARVLEEDRSAN